MKSTNVVHLSIGEAEQIRAALKQGAVLLDALTAAGFVTYANAWAVVKGDHHFADAIKTLEDAMQP